MLCRDKIGSFFWISDTVYYICVEISGNMDGEKYERLVGEIAGEMDSDRVAKTLKERRWSVRLDMIQDILREALSRSSVSMYNGRVYYFGGRIYEPVEKGVFENLIYDLLKRCGVKYGDFSRIEGVIRICRRAVSIKELRPDPAIMVFSNFVYDMNEGRARRFDRKYVQTTCVDYPYNANEHVFLWQQFLDEVLPNKTWQRVLQEFIGSIFIDRRKAKLETMMILRGNGSNGKSVVFETITGLLGRENVSNFGIGALVSGTERKRNIAFINGKRLNYCSEIQALEIGKDSDALKALISGEPTEARALYGENFTAYDIPLLMANANKMPYLRDWSHGMRRRICILPFEVEIPKHRQRRSLAEELRHEYPAIFNWVIEGRQRFIANGYKLTDSSTLTEVMDEYVAESNSVLNFMHSKKYMRAYEEIADAEPKWYLSSVLYGRYVQWCGKQGIEEPESRLNFGRILGEAGYRKKRSPKGNMYGIYGAPVLKQYEYARMKRKRQEKAAAEKEKKKKPKIKENEKEIG